ncbi:hypothetical protein BC835DRAFT_1417022 [Cytidiella melzeri]|nr:hypothetical protein BC835DRAFT_1417022 [Cytidiella melzeri]
MFRSVSEASLIAMTSFPSSQTQLYAETTLQVQPASDLQSRYKAVWDEHATCPVVPVDEGVWLTFDGSMAGGFTHHASITAVTTGVTGASFHGPMDLPSAFNVWKAGCLSGLLPWSKKMSPFSIFCRIIRTSDLPAYREHFARFNHAEAILHAPIPSNVEDSPNVPRSCALSSDHILISSNTIDNSDVPCSHTPPLDLTTGTANASFVQAAHDGAVFVDHAPDIPSDASPRAFEDGSLFSETMTTIGNHESNYFGTPDHISGGDKDSRAPTPFSSPQSVFGPFSAIGSDLRWVVIAGLRPGIYYRADDADEATGSGSVAGARVAVFNCMHEVSQAYVTAKITADLRQL